MSRQLRASSSSSLSSPKKKKDKVIPAPLPPPPSPSDPNFFAKMMVPTSSQSPLVHQMEKMDIEKPVDLDKLAKDQYAVNKVILQKMFQVSVRVVTKCWI